MPAEFVHLHVHTEYSLVDGIARIKPLVAATKAAGMPAVAVTDHCNMFGMVKFYRAALSAGIKPIIGADLLVQNSVLSSIPTNAVFLCQNQLGYKNLTRLVSRAYLEGQRNGLPIIEWAWLANATDGLIVLSGAKSGDIGQALLAQKTPLATTLAKAWAELFPGRFYIELQRTGRPQEEDYIHRAVSLAEKLQLPVVATNSVHFIAREEFDAHEARVCINSGHTLDDPRRPRNYSDKQYLRSPEEMHELFKDIPAAISNTIEIAKRCNLPLTLGKNYLPNFPVPEGMTVGDYLAHESRLGLEKRLTKLLDREGADFLVQRQVYDDRLATELDVIIKMGFPGYFLIVADFIRWAKENGIPVGPGRGSGAGSLVAYALDITDLNPLEYDLLFERFLNPERVSMPDFDIDFCMEGRDRVIDYVAEKYGRDAVSQIITYGTMAAKAVVRDVGRVLGHPYGFVDKIAKLIPFELGITLEKALQQDEMFQTRYEEEEEVKLLIDLAKQLEGITRNAGKHAGGVVIAPSKLTDFAPLYCEEDGSNLVTQFDKDDVEAVGLVKFDFLGLRTLTIIDWALQNVNAKLAALNQAAIDITTIPLNDPRVFKMLQACNTTAVFQLESRGMKDLIKRLRPDNFEEIIALVALFRPGPLQSGMVDDFIDRKHGRAVVVYPHPDLKPILQPTYGVILYQEQVMQIAQVLAGFTLGAADLLRRAMGKKKAEEMAEQRDIFVRGAEQRNVDGKLANQIFDIMEKFAGYGFNKSHSATYALLSYQTAWLKAHFPAEFMAAVLSSDMDNTDKVVNFITDAEENRLKILPPNVNAGAYKFTVNAAGEVVYGLGAIKGVGEAAIEIILEEREKAGLFADLFALCQRVDTRKVNRRVIEALIRSGALDDFGTHRASLMASIDAAFRYADQHRHDEERGQQDLFGMIETQNPIIKVSYVNVPKWKDEDRLLGEKETLGFYLSGHPIQQYEKELRQFISNDISSLKPTERRKTMMVAGYVVAVRTMMTKRGTKMAIVKIEDRVSSIEMAVFSEVYEDARPLLVKDQLLIVEGEVSVDEFSGGLRLSARRILDLGMARNEYAKYLCIQAIDQTQVTSTIGELKALLQRFRHGNCRVLLSYQNDSGRARMLLGEEWMVNPSTELVGLLNKLYGEQSVFVSYR
ncbi:MAG: DNA polymerase III subunit alpha [Pseudomonadota bacterium]|nr:DNA polymerase III subunit alpha [Pseudomonadota bacterium]